jgi:hypothetical protein
MEDLMFLFSAAIACILVGFASGQYYESTQGGAAKEIQRYHRMVMRMIPELNKHYTNRYIYEIICAEGAPKKRQ